MMAATAALPSGVFIAKSVAVMITLPGGGSLPPPHTVYQVYTVRVLFRMFDAQPSGIVRFPPERGTAVRSPDTLTLGDSCQPVLIPDPPGHPYPQPFSDGHPNIQVVVGPTEWHT